MKRHFLGTLALIAATCALAATVRAQTGENVGTVRVDTTHAINSFDPDRALGSSVDVLSRTEIDKVYTPHILEESLSAGWGPISYPQPPRNHLTPQSDPPFGRLD